MATSDILGLFMSPEQYQAQQMAQQQAAEQQRAFNFAQLSPRDQAVYSTFLGAQQLGRGFGGLLGVQDPQLQRIRQRQEIMQSINPADMKSLEAGILRASQTGDSELALSLTDFMRKQGSEMALAQQRQAQATREQRQSLPAGVQEAELIGKLTEDLQKTTDPNQRAVIQAKIKRLEKNLTKADELEDLFVALSEATAEAQSRAAPSQAVGLNGLPLPTQPTVNVDNDPRVKAIRARINTLTATPIDKQLPEVAKATALADLVSADRNSPEWQKEYATQLRRLTADKTEVEKPTEAERNAKIFAKNSGFAEGSEGFNKAFSTKFAELIGKSETTKPTEAERNATIFAKNSGFPEGSPDFNKVFNTKFAELIGKSEAAKPTEAERNATIFAKNSGFAEGSEGYNKVFKEKFAELIGKTSGKQPDAIEIADAIAGLKKQIRDAKDPNAPEILQAKDKLVILEQQLKKDKPNLSVVGEVRSGPDKGKTVYVDEIKDQQFIYSTNAKGDQVRKLISDADVSRMTSQVTATASTSNIGEKTVVKGVAELDVEDLKTARANKRAASASNDSLRNLLALDDSGLIGGAFATNRVGVANFLNTLGVLSKADSNKLANSQEYQKIGADLIFNALQGKLGAGVSNKDVDFIREIFPQLETSATARRRLIKYLADKNNKMIDEADAAEAWIRKNKSFEGYKPLNSGVFHVPSTKLDLSGMTDAELKAAIEKAKKKGK